VEAPAFKRMARRTCVWLCSIAGRGSLFGLRCGSLLIPPSGFDRTVNSGVPMHIRALLVACLVTALSLIALPANAASAIQFRKIQYDPSGSDLPATNYQLNREYVTITNTGTTTRTLTGWTVRDLANHVYTIPSFKLGPGKSVRLHTGKGTNTSTDLYWGKGWYVWNNTGDKATSRDSSGALKDTCTWGDGSGIKYC
jgi:hypothetical protein